jgi:hypothetical protein
MQCRALPRKPRLDAWSRHLLERIGACPARSAPRHARHCTAVCSAIASAGCSEVKSLANQAKQATDKIGQELGSPNLISGDVAGALTAIKQASRRKQRAVVL